ncbi:MAG: competence protein ComEA [Actinobacteria bacterium QS_5_72_10]|nr:MAG: competence protein ComEA [Actinobacteria bacterium QS_5_72_10]
MDQWRARAASLRAALRCTRAEAVALAVLLTGTVAGLGLVWWLARPAASPQGFGDVAAGGAVGGAHGPSTGDGTTAATPGSVAAGASVVVHVTGEVAEPGVVEVAAGSRVSDAIEAAGGAASNADLSRVNLAREVTDGEQIVVAHVDDPDQSEGGRATGPDGRVDVNRADAEALQRVPGIGPVTAQRLIAYREDHGPITAEQQLLDVPGVGPKTLDQLVDHLRW